MENIKSFRPQEISPSETYKLMTNFIVPRPIAFVSTINDSGQVNLAPFSFFSGVTSNPATLLISVARKSDGTLKDTEININQTKQFVVNNVVEPIWSQMVDTAANYDYGINEFSKVGLIEIPSKFVKPPRVKESSVSFECELFKTIEIPSGESVSAVIFVGLIEIIHVDEKLLDENNRVNYSNLNAVGRLGGISYSKVETIINKKVPVV
jgi:flavin reductase (DIM6/NTAB) family NADH-FMN oxidoreductase RutF